MAIDLNQQLKKYFGFDMFKGNQKAIIENLMNGGDTFVLMPTGGGKSLCYQLPALLLEGTAIVISPLIALMKNQVDAIRGYSADDGVAHFLNSSLNRAAINAVKDDVLAGKTKLLYVAPESLSKEDNLTFLKSIKVSFYAIDEAHCISEWGHDFRPEYCKIREFVNNIGRAPIIALTATAPPKVQHDILKSLGIMEAQVFKSSFNRPNLFYEVRSKQNEKNATNDIIHVLKNNPGKSAIVYCLSRKKVEEISEVLNVNGIKALPYHAGLDAATRAANQDKFLMQEVDVVCATIAFGMGIDKPDVRLVFHYDIPKSLEGYYQETGRAGRDGGDGRCIAYYSRKDVQKLEKFLQGKGHSEKEKDIGRQLISETVAYAESNDCRRRMLLSYFGENYNVPNCGCCDNCVTPKQRFNAREAVALLVDSILELNGGQRNDRKFKSEYVLDFLMGVATDQIRLNGHVDNELFGQGREHDRRYWTSVLRQSIVAGYVAKEIDDYGHLKLGKNADMLNEDKAPIMFCLDRDFSDADDDEPASSIGGTSALDEGLFEALKSIRKRVAGRHKLQPNLVFSDHSLEIMATFYPCNIEELKSIPAVGESKAVKFGEEFVSLIASYVEENEIERPQFTVVKTVANKSKASVKIKIISGVDRRLPLDTLAENERMSMDELLSAMESIVYSGNKLNIDYYLQDQYEQDLVDDVYAYFKESNDDSIKLAMEELADEEHSEELIRLVHIKFVSEECN